MNYLFYFRNNSVIKRRGKSKTVTETIVEPNKKGNVKKKWTMGYLHWLLVIIGLIGFVYISFPDSSDNIHASDWAVMPREQPGKEPPSEGSEEGQEYPSNVANVQEHTQPKGTNPPRKDAAEIPDIPQPDLSSSPTSGGWLLEDEVTMAEFGSDVCNIDIRIASDLSRVEFEEEYLLKKPVLLKFHNGAAEWTAPDKWQKTNFMNEFHGWPVHSGNSIDITRTGGVGNIKTSFGQFIDHMMNETDSIGDT